MFWLKKRESASDDYCWRERGGFRGKRRNGGKLGISLTYLGLKSPMKIYVSESINNKPCQHSNDGVTDRNFKTISDFVNHLKNL